MIVTWQNGARGAGLMVNLPRQKEEAAAIASRSLTENQRQLRVVLPPEISSASSSSTHDHCPCSKCQVYYKPLSLYSMYIIRQPHDVVDTAPDY